MSLSAARVWPFGITILIVVTEGGTASADEYTAPEPVVFGSGEALQTVSVAIADDILIEGDEIIALAHLRPAGGRESHLLGEGLLTVDSSPRR